MAMALLSPASYAQQTDDASLHSILARLQTSLDDYRASVPRLFCSEHVVSRYRRYGAAEVKTTLDSVFRLDRRDPPLKDPRLNLLEDHDLKTVDKVPVRRDSFPPSVPIMSYGVFSNAVSVVSSEMEPCYAYTLHADSGYAGHPAIEIEYRFKPEMAEDKHCHPARSSGRALFDSATLHPLRVEMTAPHYEIFPHSNLFALWRWRIDFTPVTFDGREFWLPGRINSRLDSEDQMSTWYFEATYSNYHKLIVKSHIVTDMNTEGNPPSQ